MVPQKPLIVIGEEAHVPVFTCPVLPPAIPPSGMATQVLFEKVELPGLTLGLMVADRLTHWPAQIVALVGLMVTVGFPLYTPLNVFVHPVPSLTVNEYVCPLFKPEIVTDPPEVTDVELRVPAPVLVRVYSPGKICGEPPVMSTFTVPLQLAVG